MQQVPSTATVRGPRSNTPNRHRPDGTGRRRRSRVAVSCGGVPADAQQATRAGTPPA
ncbi:hypothetical protein [Streptomyces mirabilis]